MTETIAEKAARYLAEGRLTIEYADGPNVRAVCKGTTGTWRLGRSRTSPEGFCFCPARKRPCSHLLALALVVDREEADVVA